MTVDNDTTITNPVTVLATSPNRDEMTITHPGACTFITSTTTTWHQHHQMPTTRRPSSRWPHRPQHLPVLPTTTCHGVRLNHHPCSPFPPPLFNHHGPPLQALPFPHGSPAFPPPIITIHHTCCLAFQQDDHDGQAGSRMQVEKK